MDLITISTICISCHVLLNIIHISHCPILFIYTREEFANVPMNNSALKNIPEQIHIMDMLLINSFYLSIRIVISAKKNYLANLI